MAMVKFEKWEDMSILLNASDKNLPVYLDIIRINPQPDLVQQIVKSQIWFQMKIEDIVYVYHHSDDMPQVILLPNYLFIGIRDEKLREAVKKDYETSLFWFEDAVKKEYGKAEDILKGLGYKKIIMGVVE